MMTSFINRLFKKKEASPKKEIVPVYLFNTLSREKEVFVPIKAGHAGIYTCGPTVYDFAHIGNLRTYIVSDVLRRMLEYNDYTVKQVVNITDVGHLSSDADEGEDKMTLALKREGKPLTIAEMKKVGTKYAKQFKDDLDELNVRTPFAFPRASEHIEGQIAFIKTLEEKGYAYVLPDAVYFDTAQFKNYGALGGITTEETETVSRIGAHGGKRHQRDFALWKIHTELGWDSPWGKGFPGWHIECTAMSTHYLGKHFDIHTGGIDHIPIHHNNEIAQTEAVTGRKFVNYWLHNAFITIEGKKISKSIGNTIYLRNIKDRGFPAFAYRYWLLTGHYRSPMNFTWDALEASYTGLVKLHKQFLDLGSKNGRVSEVYRKRFTTLVNDDLDTAQAIALLFELMGDDTVSDEDKRVTVLDINRVLGVGFIESYTQMKKMYAGESKKIAVTETPVDVKKLLIAREDARKEKDWEKADKLRAEIHHKGYAVEDTEEGPELTKVG
jgi:cysteinyl-tRNA synthetase